MLVGAMLMWGSEQSARSLVTTRRVPGWMSVRTVRVLYLAFGGLAIVGGLKLLLWPE
jgi:hypothetical protein